MKLEKLIEDALYKAIRILPEEVEKAISKASGTESGEYARYAFEAIGENIEKARELDLPLCQDTGMFWALCRIGRESRVSLPVLEKAIVKGAGNAAKNGFYRKSVVSDPVYERTNTKTNLPAVVNYELQDGKDIDLYFLLKGFGSENCSSVRMLNPTAGEDGVVEAVADIMRKAGGKPCPPVFLGVGIGGTMDRAALLSKKAFFMSDGNRRMKALSERIRNEVNGLGIGAMGLGGDNTCLSVSILSEPTHIAGLPVAVTVNCWADRMAHIVIKGGYDEEIS